MPRTLQTELPRPVDAQWRPCQSSHRRPPCSLGVLAGLFLIITGNEVAGGAIMLFACATMVGAGVVLLATNRRFLVSAAIQAGSPLVALLATALL